MLHELRKKRERGKNKRVWHLFYTALPGYMFLMDI